MSINGKVDIANILFYISNKLSHYVVLFLDFF